jgi:hypothetical protein
MLSTLRCFVLSARNRLRLALCKCDRCGRRGVESVSLFFPEKLCRGCHFARLSAVGEAQCLANTASVL